MLASGKHTIKYVPSKARLGDIYAAKRHIALRAKNPSVTAAPCHLPLGKGGFIAPGAQNCPLSIVNSQLKKGEVALSLTL